MRRRSFGTLIAAAALLVIAVLYARRDLAPTASGEAADADAAGSAMSIAPSPPIAADDGPPVVTPAPGIAQSAMAALHAGVPSSRTGLPLEGDPFGAHSVADQRWLDRNGYPNAAQMAALAAATASQLDAAAEGGDIHAEIARSVRRRLVADDRDAVNRLLAIAATGNTYALLALADALEKSRERPDPVFAAALRRAAELRGDSAFRDIRPFVSSTRLGPLQELHVSQQARQLLFQLDEIRRTRLRLPPMQPDPRPVMTLPPVAAGGAG